MNTGTRINQLLKLKRMTNEELAFKVGKSSTIIGNWIKGGGIKHNDLRKIANALEVSVDYLLDEKHVSINQTNIDNSTGVTYVNSEVKIETPINVIDNLFNSMDRLIDLIEKEKDL